MPENLKLARKEEATLAGRPFPALVLAAGDNAVARVVEFFTARVPNPNTRSAYALDVVAFCEWASARGLRLQKINPVQVACYIEELVDRASVATVKRHLAAIRTLFHWLVVNHVVEINPAASVRGPKHVVTQGQTPVLTQSEARDLIAAIDVGSIVGLRDRALIAVMLYTFARVSAAVAMTVGDYRVRGKRSWIKLREKGGKVKEIPAHHNLISYLDAYLEAGIFEGAGPLFRATRGRSGVLSKHGMSRGDALRMIKRRAKAAGLPADVCCHTFRGTGITAYLANGGSIDQAQKIAGHASPQTTELYDRTNDEVTLDEIERIAI